MGRKSRVRADFARPCCAALGQSDFRPQWNGTKTRKGPQSGCCEALWAWLTAVLILAAALLPGPAAAESLAVEQVAPGIYVHHGAHEEATPENLGGFANVGFIVGERSVAVIDSGGSLAHGERLRTAVRAVTDLPISHVILTHMHPDHVLGSAAFLPDAPIFVGHAKLPRALAARGDFYIERLREAIGDAAEGTLVVTPSVTVEDSLEIDLGNRVLRLEAHPTAHTDNDLSVFDVKTGTLWLSDLLFMERTPAIDGSLKGWLAVMAELRGRQAERVVPGHGPAVADWPAALDDQQRYLQTLLEQIRAVIAGGGTIENAVAEVGRSEADKWLLFEDYHPRNVVTGFTELEWE